MAVGLSLLSRLEGFPSPNPSATVWEWFSRLTNVRSVVLGGFCCSFTVWGSSNAYGVWQSYYKSHQLADRTPSDISWIGSFQLCMVMACAVISGKLFDAGYIRYLLWGGTVLFTAG